MIMHTANTELRPITSVLVTIPVPVLVPVQLMLPGTGVAGTDIGALMSI